MLSLNLDFYERRNLSPQERSGPQLRGRRDLRQVQPGDLLLWNPENWVETWELGLSVSVQRRRLFVDSSSGSSMWNLVFANYKLVSILKTKANFKNKTNFKSKTKPQTDITFKKLTWNLFGTSFDCLNTWVGIRTPISPTN